MRSIRLSQLHFILTWLGIFFWSCFALLPLPDTFFTSTTGSNTQDLTVPVAACQDCTGPWSGLKLLG